MRRMLWILAASAACALAQQPSPEPPKANPGDTLKVIEVKKAEASTLARSLNNVLGGLAQVTASSGSLIVRGSPEAVRVIEEAVAKLDVEPLEAPPVPGLGRPTAVNVELAVHLLYGSAKEDAAASVPQELEATVRQLRSVFPYRSYRVMDSFVLRSRDGDSTSSRGTLPGNSEARPTTYSLGFQAAVGRPLGEPPRLVHISNLNLSLTMPTGTRFNPETKQNDPQYQESRIATSIDAREGQKTVVGKSNVARTEDAVILLVTPKVIE